LAAFLYRCPNTGSKVQGYVAEQVSDDPNGASSATKKQRRNTALAVGIAFCKKQFPF